VVLVVLAEGSRARLACAVYVAALAGMFGASALYHLVPWRSSRARDWARRLDHAMIFVFIAGTYTPFALLAFTGVLPAVLLIAVWGGAVFGVVLNMSWIDAPRWVTTPVYLLVGWVGVIALPQIFTQLDVASAVLVVAGGVLYTLGALAYALRWPDPSPAYFGFHEVFHVLVVAAAVSQFVAVSLVATADAATSQQPVVVVDPGHDARANAQTEPIGPGSSTRKIKDGGGTRGVVSGLTEAELNLRVGLLLRPLLERAGIRVVMTRTTNAGASMGNVARARIANRAGARLFLRIHADGHSDSSVRGSHVLHPALRRGWTDDVYRESRRAAELVQRELLRALRFPDRGLQERSDFTGFNWADVPVILVELGFMTNATEDRLLATRAYQRRAAVALCRGTLRFLKRSPARCD
jgi:hemolysin III